MISLSFIDFPQRKPLQASSSPTQTLRMWSMKSPADNLIAN